MTEFEEKLEEFSINVKVRNPFWYQKGSL